MQLLELFEDAGLAPPLPAIRWAQSRFGDDYRVVWVDVAKVDASWRRDREMYVGPGGEGGIKGRYPRFDAWVREGEPVEMPVCGINTWRDCFSFGNGRHRFAWMRDHGARAVPIMVSDEQAEEVERRFGTSLRRTLLHLTT